MSGFHCLKCGDLKGCVGGNPFPWLTGGTTHRHTITGCMGRIIPIATLCSEPTVIDESDLAPGMVVVAVDEHPYNLTLLCTPDVALRTYGETWALRMTMVDHVDASDVAWVAEGRQC